MKSSSLLTNMRNKAKYIYLTNLNSLVYDKLDNLCIFKS